MGDKTTEETINCQQCIFFDAYENSEGKNQNNCIKWLCNDGKCPFDKTTEGN